MNSNVTGDWFRTGVIHRGRPCSQDQIGRRSRAFKALCHRVAMCAQRATVPNSARWLRRMDGLFADLGEPLHPGQAVSHVRTLLCVRWRGDALASAELEVGVLARAWLESIVARNPSVDRARAAHVAILFEAYLRCEVVVRDPWMEDELLVHIDPELERPAHALRHALVVHLEARRLADVDTPSTAMTEREPRQGRPRSARWGWAEALAVLTDAPDDLDHDDALKRVLASLRAAERNLQDLLDAPTGDEAAMAARVVGERLPAMAHCP